MVMLRSIPPKDEPLAPVTQRKLMLADIPERFHLAKTATFPEGSEQRRWLEKDALDIRKWLKDGVSILIGSVEKKPAWKTSVGVVLLKRAIALRQWVHFVRSQDLVKILADRRPIQGEEDPRYAAREASVLLIDDFGLEWQKDRQEWMFEGLLKHRWDHMYMTILTTRISVPEELRREYSEYLAETFKKVFSETVIFASTEEG